MFVNKRRTWNDKVAALLPTFDLTIEVVGPMAASEALDLVYPNGFGAQEGGLCLAQLTNSTFVKERRSGAANLRDRTLFAENEWPKGGIANPRTVEAWRKNTSGCEAEHT